MTCPGTRPEVVHPPSLFPLPAVRSLRRDPGLGVLERLARLLERVRRLRERREPALDQIEGGAQLDRPGEHRPQPVVVADQAPDQCGEEDRPGGERDHADAERERQLQRPARADLHVVAHLELRQPHLVLREAGGVVGQAPDEIGDPRIRFDRYLVVGAQGHIVLRFAASSREFTAERKERARGEGAGSREQVLGARCQVPGAEGRPGRVSS